MKRKVFDRGGMIAIAFTAVWLISTGGFLAAKWQDALKMPPNEWGDFLAGFFAPIAFVWLALGYFLQRRQIATSLEAFDRERIALDEERRFRQIEIGPRFRPQVQTTSRVGTSGAKCRIALTNQGGYAASLMGLIEKADGSFEVLRWPACGKAEEVRFEWTFPDDCMKSSVVIVSSDVIGGHHMCTFNMSRVDVDLLFGSIHNRPLADDEIKRPISTLLGRETKISVVDLQGLAS